MFRQQAVNNQQIKLYGNVIIQLPKPAKWIALFLTIVITSIGSLLVFGEFSRRVSVDGYLKPTAGILRIQTDSTGFARRIGVTEGQEIESGKKLFEIANRVELKSGKGLNETLREQLLMKRGILEATIEDHQQIHQISLEEQEQQLTALKRQSTFLGRQHNLLEQQLTFAKVQLDRTQQLHENKMTTQLKLDEAKTVVLQLNQQLSELLLRLESNRSQSEGIQLAKNRKRIELKNTKNQIRANILTIDQQLAELSGTKSRIIKAPQSGVITKINIKPDDLIQTGQIAMHLLPNNSTSVAKLLVPPEAIGFIEIGNNVQLRMSAFSYQKFGLQEGKVSHITHTPISNSEVPDSPILFQGSAYLITVELNKQFVSAFGKEFSLKPGMTLQADIKLAPRALWEWLLEPLLSLQGRFS